MPQEYWPAVSASVALITNLPITRRCTRQGKGLFTQKPDFR
jgi:hypothetical protein